MAEIVRTKGGGWIDFMWPHPRTKKVQQKSAYVVKIPGYDGYIGSGIYEE
jgi:signal transduction histidine kinase